MSPPSTPTRRTMDASDFAELQALCTRLADHLHDGLKMGIGRRVLDELVDDYRHVQHVADLARELRDHLLTVELPKIQGGSA